MDVLVVHGELHLIRLNVRQDGLQPLHNLLRLVRLNDPGLAQHGGVGDGPPDILRVQPRVEADGGIELVDQGVGLLLKPARPEFHT